MVRLHLRGKLSFLLLKHFLHFAKRRQKMESLSVVNWVGKAYFLQSFCCLLNKCSQTQLFMSNISSTRHKDEKKRFWQCILSEWFKSYMYSCTCMYIQKSGNFEPKKTMTFSLTYQYALFAIIPPTPQLKSFIEQLISFLEGISLHIALQLLLAVPK